MMLMRPRSGGSVFSGGDTPHRYWRVLVETVNGGTYAGLSELELRATPGGLDLTDPATASTSASATAEYGTYVAANGFDDVDTSRWLCQVESLPAALRWDFGPGGEVSIVEISIYISTSYAYAPESLQVQFSDDDVTWETEWSWQIAGGLLWNNYETKVITKPGA